jgi:hypothetical protein
MQLETSILLKTQLGLYPQCRQLLNGASSLPETPGSRVSMAALFYLELDSQSFPTHQGLPVLSRRLPSCPAQLKR